MASSPNSSKDEGLCGRIGPFISLAMDGGAEMPRPEGSCSMHYNDNTLEQMTRGGWQDAGFSSSLLPILLKGHTGAVYRADAPGHSTEVQY